jgi:hypothetical protein
MSEAIRKTIEPTSTDTDTVEQPKIDPSYKSGKHLPIEQYPTPENPNDGGPHLPTMPDPTKDNPSQVKEPPADRDDSPQIERRRAS